MQECHETNVGPIQVDPLNGSQVSQCQQSMQLGFSIFESGGEGRQAKGNVGSMAEKSLRSQRHATTMQRQTMNDL